MIEVRIRHEDETDSVSLCMWDVNRLDDVIPLLHRWGVAYNDRADDWELSGQFVVTATSAYFEVIIGAPEDGAA